MNRTARRIAAVLVTVASCAATSVAVPYPVGPSNTLSVGQTLRPPLSDPTGSAIVSTNSEYQLGIYYNARTQHVRRRRTRDRPVHPRRRCGPLDAGRTRDPADVCGHATQRQLRPVCETRVAIWSTHTAGTGSNNRLVMRNDGNLVMYTASGRAVWSSGTHAEVLSSGDKLYPAST